MPKVRSSLIADLIRNFLLMRIHVNEQQKIFDQHWRPIQEALGDQLTEFVRHFLMKEGKIIKSSEIYFELKDRVNAATPDEAKKFLADLHTSRNVLCEICVAEHL